MTELNAWLTVLLNFQQEGVLLKHGENDFGCTQPEKTALSYGWDLLLLLIMHVTTEQQ